MFLHFGMAIRKRFVFPWCVPILHVIFFCHPPARDTLLYCPSIARKRTHISQIRFLLLQNRQGKTRLSKWYITLSTEEKIKTQTEVHRLVTNRDPKFTNFIEVPNRSPHRSTLECPLLRFVCCTTALHFFPFPHTKTLYVQYGDYKVIYRRYAGLFFSLCVDINDNELVHLESIHLFVELLDQFFGNVCELDLVFNFHKVLVHELH
jgi:AP-2 complex subunit sigma-1